MKKGKKDRKRLINKLINESSKILGIEVPKVKIKRFWINKNIQAKTKNENLIYLNKKWLENAKVPEIILCVFHESRHTYQMRVVKYFNTDDYRKELWKENFINYFSPDEDDKSYIHQDVELDAIAYSNYLAKKIFDIDETVVDSINDIIKKKMEIMPALVKNNN